MSLFRLFNELEDRKGYLIIDMPGQLELYNSDDSVRKIVDELTKKGFRLCAVHLSDSMHCSDVGKFVAVIFSALSIMINLEIAQINVLSKSDLLQENLPFDLSFFEELPDLRYLTDRLEVSKIIYTTIVNNFRIIQLLPSTKGYVKSWLK